MIDNNFVTEKPKILFIHHGWGIGGAPLSLLNLVKSLNKRNYSVKVIFLKYSDVVPLFEKANINYEVFSDFFFSKFYTFFEHTESKSYKFKSIHKLLRSILSWILCSYIFAPKILRNCQEFNIVHLNSIVLSDWAIAAKKNGFKVVMHIREPLGKGVFGLRNYLIRNIIKQNTDHLISISKDNALRLKMTNKTTIVHNQFSENQFIGEKNNSYNNKSILYVGGKAHIKGFGVMKELIGLLPNDIMIKLAGHYSVDYVVPKSNVIVLGLLSESEMQKQLVRSSLLIVPNLYPHFSRPIIEAYYSKTPVIASDIKGMGEIVIDKVTGYLVSVNSKEFASVIIELIYNTGRLKEMGLNGFEFAKRQFNSESSCDEVIKIYSTLSQ